MRKFVTTEEIAQALRLVIKWREDRGPHRTVFGFTDE
jgi:hypothetical protein